MLMTVTVLKNVRTTTTFHPATDGLQKNPSPSEKVMIYQKNRKQSHSEMKKAQYPSQTLKPAAAHPFIQMTKHQGRVSSADLVELPAPSLSTPSTWMLQDSR